MLPASRKKANSARLPLPQNEREPSGLRKSISHPSCSPLAFGGVSGLKKMMPSVPTPTSRLHQRSICSAVGLCGQSRTSQSMNSLPAPSHFQNVKRMKAKVAHPDCSIFTPHGESESFEDSNHLGRRIAASVQNHEHRSGYERFVRSQCTIDIEVRACLFQGARSDSIRCRTAFTRTGLSQRILSRRLFAAQYRIETRGAHAAIVCEAR